MSTALVTGAAGFIGHHLVERLLASGWKVVGYDDLSCGTLENLKTAQADSNFRFIKGDILDVQQLSAACTQTKPDTVFHLAALHFIPACDRDPARTIELNTLGTQRVIDATAFSFERFILASTGDVYAPAAAPHNETNARGSLGIYGVSKAAAEDALHVAAKREPAKRFFVARFFNAYGTGETNPHVIPDILKAIKAGGTLKLGNLAPVRDYIHTSDLAEGLVQLSKYNGTHTTFNLGAGQGRTVTAILDAMSLTLGRKLDVESVAEKIRPVERQSLVADITRATAELGWRPQMDFDAGIAALLHAEGLA